MLEFLTGNIKFQKDLDLSNFNVQGHEKKRKYFKWGTYGRDGDQELLTIKLLDISDLHLLNIQVHLFERINQDIFNQVLSKVLEIIEHEIHYRALKGIYVEEKQNYDELSN